MEAFYREEERDGIRFSWNSWPVSKNEATKMVLPLACMYSPFKQSPNIPKVQYEPVMCGGNCRTILNPHCDVDVNAKIWTCPFCYRRNPFPPHYSVVTATNLPAELVPAFTTIEYILPRSPALAPVFLYVVDTCMSENELGPLKDALLRSLCLLPENALVGLITFGNMVQVHELAFEGCPKSYVFSGKKELQPEQVKELLGIQKAGAAAVPAQQQQQAKRFIKELKICEETLETIMEELQPDPSNFPNDQRKRRSTGVALSVAIGLMESGFTNCAGRIMTFVSGPCTQGPGLVVGESLKEFIRAHHDIQNDNARHMAKATKHYTQLAAVAAKNGHVIDIFGCSLDQIGLLEMRALVQATGGIAVLADDFASPMFTDSFNRIFQKDEHGFYKIGFNAAFEIQTCKELKVCGAIGQCASLNKTSPSVSESVVGVGGTTAWRLCGMDPSSTLALYFDVAAQTPATKGQKGVLQFQTHYQNSFGQKILRVTTVSRPWADPNLGNTPLIQGFDQEAAAVLMARYSAFKAETQDTRDILRWLDRSLIRLCSRFAEYRKGEAMTFSLNPMFALYPQFMFHLRRSDLLQVFNNSPDETCFKRLMANRECVDAVLMMIQPTLEAYTLENPEPTPVMLSATSLSPDRILVLDTFFHVCVWTGDKIAEWRNQKYHEKPEFEHLKKLLEAPENYVEMVRKERFPAPRFIKADEGKSQARFLTAKVDPAITPSQFGGNTSEIMTEDVKLEVFMDHLKNLAVANQPV